MASAWGASWGSAWGPSWGATVAQEPVLPVWDTTQGVAPRNLRFTPIVSAEAKLPKATARTECAPLAATAGVFIVLPRRGVVASHRRLGVGVAGSKVSLRGSGAPSQARALEGSAGVVGQCSPARLRTKINAPKAAAAACGELLAEARARSYIKAPTATGIQNPTDAEIAVIATFLVSRKRSNPHQYFR